MTETHRLLDEAHHDFLSNLATFRVEDLRDLLNKVANIEMDIITELRLHSSEWA